MPQIKIQKTGNFTVLGNTTLQDGALSCKALGLLVRMLSLPEDWDYSIAGLSRICKEGKDAIRGAVKELMDAGYIVRRQAHGADGRLDGYEYTVYDTPQEAQASPSSDNPTMDAPSSGNPSTEKPSLENPTQQNIISTKKDFNKTPCSPPRGDGGGTAKPKKTAQPYNSDWFDAFWAKYPRKDNKQQARRAWDKLRPDKDTCRRMSAALERDKRSRQWRKDGGEFIPMPSTWLNQRRWENMGVDPEFSMAPVSAALGGWAADPEVIR